MTPLTTLTVLTAVLNAPCNVRTLLILEHLSRGEPMLMGAAARLCGISCAAMTGLVDRAEKRGLLKRSLLEDRRAISLAITPGGLRCLAEFGRVLDGQPLLLGEGVAV